MLGMDWDGLTANERLIAEQAVMNFRALNAACNAAADGTVLGTAEQLAVKQGREATRRTLEMSLQMQDTDLEKKNAPSRTCGCGITKSHHGRKTRRVMTQAGEVQVSRVYRCCVKCKNGGYALDNRLGIQGRYSPHAQRLVSLAAASWSYDVSSERLEALCGVSISDTTIREIAQETGAKMLNWQRTEPEAVREFCSATGDLEFTTDGTSVNTTEGNQTFISRRMELYINTKSVTHFWSSYFCTGPKIR